MLIHDSHLFQFDRLSFQMKAYGSIEDESYREEEANFNQSPKKKIERLTQIFLSALICSLIGLVLFHNKSRVLQTSSTYVLRLSSAINPKRKDNAPVVSDSQKPNFIMIVADDMVKISFICRAQSMISHTDLTGLEFSRI